MTSLSVYRSEAKASILLAYPVMISMLGQVMTGVADSIMIGWTGAIPLAAASLANSFFSVLLFFGIGVSYAITPLVAEAAGSDDHQRIADTLRHGLIINLVTGVLLVTVVLAGVPVLYHMGQAPEVVDLGIPYLLVITSSIIPTMIFQTFRQFGEGLHRTRMAMVVMIVSNLLNVLLNYLLIYGIWIFPELGLLGAGYATLIARIVMALWMGLYIYYGSRFRLYRAGIRIGNYSRSLLSRLLHIAIPAGAQFIFEAAAFGFSAIMMGWLGADTLAAHQIALNLATVSYMTTSGLGAAATVRVGTFLGRRDQPSVRRTGFTLIVLGAGIMLVWAVAFISGKKFLPGLYLDDPNVLAIAAPLMIIAGFFQMSDGMQVVCAGALRGLQDVKIPSLLIFVAYWILALPAGYVLAFQLGWGAVGIWFGLLLGLTLTATAMVARFNSLSKRPL